ncbi:glycoside hydrolase family 43 protein [Streptomyces litchfieldiae]|uniref:Glycoside hydrolase family 43 protein n=1 Tax=Streptomyces litchfieldiae TaxID=3075543 RepID=A0ABU2MVW8_9ACTN|nr:glycoside hydrolase family 43 protein [Streptomyces sp. DSM 44938]MDT0345739.1 glycoside hydrolase family 43 protein [Streptomyces sp. DSM 44938]
MYDNPVIAGFHPDPSVCRVEEDYYLVCSSFEYFPGVPLFHSRDLVHWRQVGNVLDRPAQLPLPPELPASGGIFAPTLRHHDGRFWLITTNVAGGGNFVVTAERPEGPWSDPVWLDLPGIDPDLAWAEDGSCWCAFSSASGIQTARVDPLTGAVLEGPWPLWSGTGLQYPEAPHLHRVGEWWYLVLAEGGTERGHSVSVARGRSPRGSFEPAPGNPILSHRSTDRPIQSTGHADLVSAPDGTWWMTLLGTRPTGRTPQFHVLGRETFLAPVEWEDGWPVVGPVQQRHPAPAAWHPFPPLPARDDFDAPRLAPHWISPRTRPDGSWSLGERPGWLTLTATGPTLDRPGHTFVGRRQQHHDCRISALLDPASGRAGLSVRLDEAHHYDLEVDDGHARVIARVGPLRQCVAEHPVPPGPLTLVIDIRTTDMLPPSVTTADGAAGEPLGVLAGGPDTLAFSVHAPEPVPLAELDGRYLSTEVATGFTGRVIGMYATRGSAHFDWFDYRPTTPSAVP